MKNLYLFLALALLTISQRAWSQTMIAYDVQTTVGTYTEVTDGTVISIEETGSDFNGMAISGDGEAHFTSFTKEGFPIGFDFQYDGKAMNQFVPATNGYVMLGDSAISWSAASNQFKVFANNLDKDLFGFAYSGKFYGLPTTQLSYKVEGEAPSRVLVVQYKDLGITNRSGKAVIDTVQVQYRLYEATGNLSLTLQGFQPDASFSSECGYFKIGMLGTGSDRLMITNYEGTSTSTTDDLISWNNTTYPQDGVTYTFVAPEPCVTPAEGASNLQVTTTSTALKGSFTPGDADHYLVLSSTDAELSEMPADGTTYTARQKLGNAVVIAAAEDTTFSSRDIYSPSTEYHVFVIGYNSKCLNGPLYNTTAIISTTATTQPDAPQSLEITKEALNSLTVKAEAAGEAQMIIAETNQLEEKRGTLQSGGLFGTPSGTYQVGDSISGGGRIVYIGASSDNITIDGLTEGTLYNLRAWSVGTDGNYSSLYTTAAAYTVSNLPWQMDTSKGEATLDGYDTEGTWELSWLENVEDVIEVGDENGLLQWITTPAIQLSENGNRLFSDIAMTQMSYPAEKAYELRAGDTLRIQLTEDGTTFEDIAVYTMDNAPTFGDLNNPSQFVTTFDNKAGKVVRVRYFLRTMASLSTFTLLRSRMIAKPEVDYPIDLHTEAIGADTALVAWTPQGDETQWQVAWKLSDAEEWGEAVSASDTCYTLTGLETYKKYNVRVRAVNSEGKYSDWTEATFISALCAPFTIQFEELTEAPEGWTSCTGELSEETVLEAENEDNSSFTWSNNYETHLRYYTYRKGVSHWYVSPTIAVKEGNKYTLTVNLTTDSRRGSSASTDNTLTFLASHNGESFVPADSFRVVSYDELEPSSDLEFSGTFDGFNGNTRLALLVQCSAGIPLSFTIHSLSLSVEEPTSIQGVETTADDANATAKEIYNAAGQRINSLQPGLNIIKMSNGKTIKRIEN